MDCDLIRKKLEGYLGNRWLRQDPSCTVLVPFFMNKARHNLETAKVIRRLSSSDELKALVGISDEFEAFDWVITCCYYAMFHAASAALATLGLRSTKHEVVIQAVEYHFVHKQELLDECHIENLQSARELDTHYINRLWAAKKSRTTAQYETDRGFSQSEAERVILSADEFITRIAELLEELDHLSLRDLPGLRREPGRDALSMLVGAGPLVHQPN